MKVVIVGCGRIGSNLGVALAGEGHDVSIIDRDARAFERRLDPDFSGARIVGNAMDEDVLVRAGIKQADVVVTVTEGDNRNIMIAQMARVKFQVPKVLARIVDPLRARAYAEFGVETVDQTSFMTAHVRQVVLGEAPDQPAAAGE